MQAIVEIPDTFAADLAAIHCLMQKIDVLIPQWLFV